MIEEILVYLKLPWVQDFILRSHPRQYVNALSDPSNYSRSISGVLDCSSILHQSRGVTSAVRSVRLLVPEISIANIGVGICVEDAKDSRQVVFSNSLKFSRFVCNNRRNSQLLVRFMEDTRKVTLSHTIFGEDALWIYVHLQINYTSFIEVFETRTSAVAFQLINQNITPVIPYRQKPLVSAHHRYPNKVSDVLSENLVRNIVSAYSKGKPVKALSLFGLFNFSFN